MIERVLSGGQNGVDQGAWRAAVACSIPTSGWMPLGFLTLDGPRPEFAEMYGAREHPSPLYPPRTFFNARDSDGTLWIGSGDSRGYGCTMNACRKAKKPVFSVMTRGVKPTAVVEWIERERIVVLNCAGNRESVPPGLGKRAEEFLIEVFRLLK